jgi:hypothetical protein
MKVFDYASTLEVKFEGDHYTRYGFHLNTKGKDLEFPTRIANGCTPIIDNIYIDKILTRRYIACPVKNGLSHHDAQLIKLENIFMQKKANENSKKL